MFRFIKTLFTIIVLIFAVIGFMSVGGDRLVEDFLAKFIDHSKDARLERTRIVGDFTRIGEEFEVDKAIKLFGYTAVVSEHKASSQKMIVLEPGKNSFLSEKDISSGDLNRQIKDLSKKMSYKVKINDLKITSHGMLTSYGKLVPYAKFEADVERLPIRDLEGIISVVDDVQNGHARVLISLNERGKYSNLIAREFFSKIKVAE